MDIPSPSSPTTLQLLYTAEINALGYCKCALLPLTAGHALVAVPAVLDDSLIDVIHLPSCKRVYRSVGKDCFDTKTGTVMALAIYASPASLRIFASYEDGRTALFEQAGSISDFAAGKLGEDEGWQLTLSEKLHKEPSQYLLPPRRKRWLTTLQRCLSHWRATERRLGLLVRTTWYRATFCQMRCGCNNPHASHRS